MAIKDKNGNLKGIIGNLVIYNKAGVQHYRTRTAHRNDKSPLVFNTRNNFSYVMQLIQKFKPLINTGFRDQQPGRSAYHSALSANMRNYTFAQNAGALHNLHWFQTSEGNLSSATSITAQKTPDGKILVQWQHPEPTLESHPTDLVSACLWYSASNTLLLGPPNITRDAGFLIIDPLKLSLKQATDLIITFTVNPARYRPGSDRNVSKSKWLSIE